MLVNFILVFTRNREINPRNSVDTFLPCTALATELARHSSVRPAWRFWTIWKFHVKTKNHIQRSQKEWWNSVKNKFSFTILVVLKGFDFSCFYDNHQRTFFRLVFENYFYKFVSLNKTVVGHWSGGCSRPPGQSSLDGHQCFYEKHKN